jgi:hypothetical protein
MHKIDGIDATPDRRFQDPNPAGGILGTVVTAKWLDAVQEELANLVEGAGLTLSDVDNGQVLQAVTALYGSGVAGGSLKNRLINGDFRLFQRGASINVTNAQRYTADRWNARADAAGAGTGTATISRQAFATGQTDVPGNPTNYLRWVQNTIATNGQPSLAQPIEDVQRFSGGKVSVSFYARAAASLSCALRLIQVLGAGGSADQTVAVQAFTAGTAWTRYAYTFDLPSLAGLTLGTNSYLRTSVTTPTGQTFTLELADFQVELADEASGFDRRPLGLELLLASRFYVKSYPLDVAPATDGGAGNERRGCGASPATSPEDTGAVSGTEFWYQLAARLVVPMRAPPTVTWYKPVNAGATSTLLLLGSSSLDLNVISTLQGGDSLTGYPRTDTVNSAPGNLYHALGHWTAEAEL